MAAGRQGVMRFAGNKTRLTGPLRIFFFGFFGSCLAEGRVTSIAAPAPGVFTGG
jgi:hypothetical protein